MLKTVYNACKYSKPSIEFPQKTELPPMYIETVKLGELFDPTEIRRGGSSASGNVKGNDDPS